MQLEVFIVNLKRILYLSVIALVVWAEKISTINPTAWIICFIATGVAAFALFFYALNRLGIPANRINPDKILDLKSVRNVIKIQEIRRGVWQIQDKYMTTLDMHNWIRRKKYIADIINTILVLDYYNTTKQRVGKLCSGIQRFKYEKLSIVFIDRKGKKTRKSVVENYVISKCYHVRHVTSIELTPGHRGGYFNPYQEMKLKLYYHFKIDKSLLTKNASK